MLVGEYTFRKSNRIKNTQYIFTIHTKNVHANVCEFVHNIYTVFRYTLYGSLAAVHTRSPPLPD